MLLSLLVPMALAAAPLHGVVLDDTGGPVPGVLVIAGDSSAITDSYGNFTLDLPPGPVTVSTQREGFTVASAAVEVGEEALEITFTIAPENLPSSVIEVIEQRSGGSTVSVMQERKEATGVNEVVGVEQMKKAGDADAAAALRRVTGLTVVDGRYVFVRGLGDRYSASMLNGSMLPSPEPEKRVVPLDLFPTAMLEAVVVRKSWSPELPAEMGGGVVQIRTRGVPDHRTLTLGASMGYRGGTTFTGGPTGPRGPTDFLGIDGGYRDMPTEVSAASAEHPIKAQGIFSSEGYSADELESFGEAIENRWELGERTVPPDFSLSASAGGSLNTPGPKLGAVVGLVYNNAWQDEEATRRVWSTSGDSLILRRDTSYERLENQVGLGGIAALSASFGDQAVLRSTTMLSRISRADAVLYEADDPTGSGDSRSVMTDWVEQQLLFEQLTGEHKIGEAWSLDWRYAYSQADRSEPDRREYTYLLTEDGYRLSQKGSWNEILYATLRDTAHDAGLDISREIRPDAPRPGAVSAGVSGLMRERSSTTRRFTYELMGSDGMDLSRPIGEVITPENIGADSADDTAWLRLQESTSNSDDYTARQVLGAAYVSTDLPLGQRFRLAGGARVERSLQEVQTFELFNPAMAPVSASLLTTDLLPGATLSTAIGGGERPDDMLLRLGYGRTLSHPELRELSEVPYTDFRTGVLYYGNPDLVRATIDNVDLRWEWYFRPGESVSLGAFYKRFQDPIESIAEVSAVSGLASSFANAEAANNLGLELDGRLKLGGLHPALDRLYVAGNGALIRSRVVLGEARGNDTSAERPLQGQSPWVLNAQLGWEDPNNGVNLAVLYNVAGPRISEVGQSGIPDTYAMPVHRLDASVIVPLRHGVQLRFKATNLLDWPTRQETGGELAEELRDGRALSLGVQWSP